MPGDAVVGNAYDVEDALPGALRFPHDLAAAADRLEASDHARAMLGDTFVDHYVMSRRWECGEYRRNLNSWQLERYFEII